MGKTVPAYRMALEEEISRWSGFARALHKALSVGIWQVDSFY